ncbi:uncharacterized protein Dwil_GK19341 [Drosophila willistoni]|uniref:Gustatory receptor n=1 Tax=Drosophila willistoni TaxID=7260 RepID=B4MNK5_DROWI|nr:uncharacterized protein Dwil_GK19341 [Drosophila willistoni]
MYFLTALLNSIVSQYFFAMLHVHGHYMLLNLELSRLLSKIHEVNTRRRYGGIFMSKCCALADQLDEIAGTQSKLQRLVEKMSKIFGLQSFCISATYYLSSVATIYFTFCAFKYSASGLGTSPFGLAMISCAIICYYIDNLLVIFANLYTLDAHDEMLKLMEQRCLYPAGLDQRLETAFERFQLQLARNPLKMTVLGLFELNRCSVIAMIASYLFGERIRSVLLNPNYLHQYVFLVVGIVRVCGVFVTILFRWRERQELVKLVNALYQLFVKRPHVERLYRRGVLNKFLFALLSELLQMFIMLTAVSERLTFGIGLQLYIISIITAILNVIVTQYYFAMLNIHGHYILLIQELRDVLDAISQLNPHRMGVFITKCCFLADQMDNIAERQSQLQALIKRISKVFGAQYFCINFTYFLTNVATIYFTYITVLVLLYIEDAHGAVVRLLQSRTSLPLGLDERLELTFESFQLQLVRNPFEISCLGLYRVGRRHILGMANTLLTTSIFLIQYDIEHF